MKKQILFLFLVIINLKVVGSDFKELQELNKHSYEKNVTEGYKVKRISLQFKSYRFCYNICCVDESFRYIIKFPLENITFLKFKEIINEFLERKAERFKDLDCNVTDNPKYFFCSEKKATVYTSLADDFILDVSDYDEIIISFRD